MSDLVTFVGPRENSGPFTMPRLIREGLDKHADQGRKVGQFLEAVLCNDLSEAVCRADAESMACLRDIVKYVYNDLPGRCWGSVEKVTRWRVEKEKLVIAD